MVLRSAVAILSLLPLRLLNETTSSLPIAHFQIVDIIFSVHHPGFGGEDVVPELTSNPVSRLFFDWLTPFLTTGFSRPLEKDDFWQLPDDESSSNVADRLERNLLCTPMHLRDIDAAPSTTASPAKDSSDYSEKTDSLEKGAAPVDAAAPAAKKYDESMFKAIHNTFAKEMWIAGVLRLFADTLKTTTPLVTRVMLNWVTESYVYHRLSEAEREGQPAPRGIGFGVGLAFALFAMQELSSLLTNHSMQITMKGGLHIRSGLIAVIFRKALRISGKGRSEHNAGQITTMISTDATRLDRFATFAHILWIAPIQLAIGIGLLIGNLGYSAVVGLGVLILGLPLQIILVTVMFKQRAKGVKFTDKRIRLTTEVLQGIRLIKFFGWEPFYAQQMVELRKGEIHALQLTAVARSGMISLMTFIPILAAILSFVTYALTNHELNIAIIFSSLQLFNIIRMPLLFFPFVLASLSDALVAIRRIGTFLLAEDLPKPYEISNANELAVNADGDFAWETVGAPDHGSGAKKGSKEKKAAKKAAAAKKKASKEELPTHMDEKAAGNDASSEKTEEEKPFELKNVNLRVARGSFVGIVGRVGSGKSSVLQALIGEMRKTRGDVKFGGSVAYSPQSAWIRNATLRENILFGQEDDPERFDEVVHACSLEHDIEMLPEGDQTEIGEKGINLSGGQKARVSLARAAYSKSDIVLLDDPLSAVDAYVGKKIMDDCLLNGPLAKRTRVLVTHSLHVLDKLDYIYVMDHGEIIEHGTYEDLMANSVVFSRIVDEYGNAESDSDDEEEGGEASRKTARRALRDMVKVEPVSEEGQATKAEEKVKTTAALMQQEEREQGSVNWKVYSTYMKAAGGLYWGPFLLMLLTLNQAASVGNTLFLGFWTAGSVPGFKQGHYMAVYAGLGGAQAIFTFVLAFCFTLACLRASLNLFRGALSGVLYAPVSFFDTTPMGRIVSRFSKDQDTLDTDMSMNMFQFLTTLWQVLGTIGLVFYTFPYLGIVFVPLAILYQLVSIYYRRTSVEAKRWDSLLRSVLYASFSESLTGVSTIRAYREQDRSIKDAERGLDYQNRAYFMLNSLQRWLAVRLDLFGNILLIGIALFAAGFRTSVSPDKIGVVLTYTLGVTQFFSEMVAQYALIEQNMNAVERLKHYGVIPSEGARQTPADPPASWPAKGTIDFTNVKMAYREGLPLVLKDASFQIRAGEKVGIVGRTGAGKSSLLQALFRLKLDGVDTRHIGLETLRTRLALVPQDSVLFLGTLRDNIDPQRTRTDAELIQVLQRAWLLPRDGKADPATEAKFSLDAIVGDEGSNFSAGEKQLLALARALVKNSRVIVLDEATSSVDVETDAKLQRTIQTEFNTSTLLCIAHRLNTIAYYDRVLVMDQGKVAEFDTVLNLFDKEDSIFRSLCDEANLQRADILRIRSEHQNVTTSHST
ncbi:ATP-dependent bile acid permease [Coprinopsis sp. MPI-PUGE-AT-0042]|nr:ATP-dependent bile acid permease [Coprinopsis sp. MPI-PUGE-AT-0042]